MRRLKAVEELRVTVMAIHPGTIFRVKNGAGYLEVRMIEQDQESRLMKVQYEDGWVNMCGCG